MALGFELARTNTALGGSPVAHARRLMASWQVLADLCFADLLFLAAIEGEEGHRFVVLGQVRSTTDQTLYTDDMVGTVVGEVERPLISRAWREGEIVEGETKALGSTERARIKCIPVRCEGRLIGLVTRETPLQFGRRAGSLEREYFEVFDRFARMIAEGSFPFPRDEVEFEDAPRVADGVIILDGDAQIRFASPNAISSLHRMGIHAYASGQRLAEIGFDQDAVDAALAARLPVTEEVERGDTSILIRALLLLDAGDAGNLRGDVATALAVVLNELMQNAVDHAFPRDGAGPTKGSVLVQLARLDGELVVEVIDDGVGLPPGFTVESSKGLGLSIVQALVNGELGGSMELGPSARNSRGTHVRLRVRLAPSTPVGL